MAICISSFSQKIIIKISKDVCNCTDTIDIATLNSNSALGNLEICLGQIVYHSSDLKNAGYDILNEEDIELVTEKLMKELFKACDSFVSLMLKISPANVSDTLSKIGITKDCELFRKGEFFTLNTEDSIITIMNDSKQFVKNISNNTNSEYSIEWLSDCEYLITYIKGTDPVLDKLASQIGTMKVQIINVEGDEITFLSSFKGNKIETKMKRIE